VPGFPSNLVGRDHTVGGQTADQVVLGGIDAVDRLQLGGQFSPGARIDQDHPLPALSLPPDEEGAHGHVDPVVLVRGVLPLPEEPGDHAEHGPSVEPEIPRLDPDQRPGPDPRRHRRQPRGEAFASAWAWASSQRSASMAARQPVPAAVIAWR
jgi:hypothetical protein